MKIKFIKPVNAIVVNNWSAELGNQVYSRELFIPDCEYNFCEVITNDNEENNTVTVRNEKDEVVLNIPKSSVVIT